MSFGAIHGGKSILQSAGRNESAVKVVAGKRRGLPGKKIQTVPREVRMM
jgi:hypothetical protein